MPAQQMPSPPMTPELAQACDEAVHIVCPDGTLLRAGYGSLYVLRSVGWWWVTPLMWPPLLWLVELAYWCIARNRIFFSRFLFRDE